MVPSPPVDESSLEREKFLLKEASPIKPTSSLPPLRLALSALLVSLGGSFNFGYQLVLTNPSQEAFISFLNSSFYGLHESQLERKQLETAWSLIVASFFWGCTCGAFLIHTVASRLGRTRGLQLSHLLQISACALAVFSYYVNNYQIFIVSRFMLGLSLSLSLGISPMFIAECSPKSCRGVVSLSTGTVLQIAIVVGAVMAMPQIWGNTTSWHQLYWSEIVLTCLVVVFMPLLHESPSYLSSRGKVDQCEKSLIFYHNVPLEEAKSIREDMELEQSRKLNQKALGLIDVLKNPISRRGTIIGCVIIAAVVMSGIAAINAFAFEILLDTGLTRLQASVGNIVICFMSVLGILFSSLVIDRYGRRPLLIYTYGFLAIINCVIFGFMISFHSYRTTWLGYSLIGAICVFNFVFALGPGPVSFFVTSELVDQQSRGASCTWVNVVMSLGRSFLLAGYLPLKNIIGASFAYVSLFVPPLIFTVIFLYFNLPETKGRSSYEVEAAYQQLPALRKRKRTQIPIVP